MQFAQHRDVFICDIMVVIKVYHGQLYYLYNDGNSSFSSDEFWAFKGLLDYSLHIHMKWVTNLNDSNEQLAFIVNGDKCWAMHNDPVLKVMTIVTQDSFQSLISQVKLKCSSNTTTKGVPIRQVISLDFE
jgi:hypothetical protein